MSPGLPIEEKYALQGEESSPFMMWSAEYWYSPTKSFCMSTMIIAASAAATVVLASGIPRRRRYSVKYADSESSWENAEADPAATTREKNRSGERILADLVGVGSPEDD